MKNYEKAYETITERINERIRADKNYGKNGDGTEIDIYAYRALLVPTEFEGECRYKDIDYESDDHANWPRARIFDRAFLLAKYYTVAEGEEKKIALEVILSTLKDAARHKYECGNWWYNDIGVPMTLKNTMLLLKDEIDEELKMGLVWFLDHGSVVCHPKILTVKDAYHSGCNLVWYCNVSIVHGILTNNPDEILAALGGIAEETKGGLEGAQWDGSFFQHGRRLYSWGYGRGYVSLCADTFYYVDGTELDFTDEQKGYLAHVILDGMRYMVGGTSADYSAMGREYGRWNSMSVKPFAGTLRRLAECKHFPRLDEILDFADRIEKGAQQPRGIKYFPEAKHLSLRTDDMYLSFKGTDPTLFGAEICTSENYLGRNLSYGTNTCFIRRGDEYFNIGPLWDYASIPGTTSRYETDEELRAYPDFTWYKVTTDDFGGESFGDEAAVCFVGSEHHGVNSVVSAFTLPYGMVFLGAGLRECDGKPLHTTVNQCWAKTDIEITDTGATVKHDGIVYRSFDKWISLRASVSKRHTDHFRNSVEKAKMDYTGDIFTLDFAVDPAHPSYAYGVFPEEEAERGVEVIRNDEEIQAIALPEGGVLAVFHKAGAFEFGGKEIRGEKNEVVFER